MITLTKIDGDTIIINAEEIETVETMKDTVISLRSGKKIVVTENYKVVIDLTIQYKRKCYSELIGYFEKIQSK